jgi:hypothetical protein
MIALSRGIKSVQIVLDGYSHIFISLWLSRLHVATER